MLRNNSFRASDNKRAIFTTKALEAIKKRGSFAIPDNLISSVIKTDKYWVDLIDTEYTKEDIIHTFLIDSEKKKLIIKLSSGVASIQYGNVYEEYKIRFVGIDGYCTNLIKQEDIYFDKKINIDYPDDSQYMTIEIIFNSRKFVIKTMYDVNIKYSTDILRTLSINSSIFDLKRFYMQNFYVDQSDYEKRNDTFITIYEDIDGNYEVIDEIIVKDGQVASYIISSIKNNIIISAKGLIGEKPNITIRNYMPSNIDLNKEANQLLARTMGLK